MSRYYKLILQRRSTTAVPGVAKPLPPRRRRILEVSPIIKTITVDYHGGLWCVRSATGAVWEQPWLSAMTPWAQSAHRVESGMFLGYHTAIQRSTPDYRSHTLVICSLILVEPYVICDLTFSSLLWYAWRISCYLALLLLKTRKNETVKPVLSDDCP